MEPLYWNIWAWCSWLMIGVAAGSLAGYILPGRRIKALDITIGIIGAVIGGWGSALAIGDGSQQTFAIAALCALCVSGTVLWIYNTVLIRISGRK